MKNKKVNILISILQFAAGVLFVYALVWVFNMTSSKVAEQTLPQGWQIIRPPYEISALAVQGDIVWVGGRDGISVFAREDGREKDVPLVLSNLRYINDILVDKKGIIWIAHNVGLTSYEKETGKVINFTPEEGMLTGSVAVVYQDKNGLIWVGNEQGLVSYDGEKWLRYNAQDGLGIQGVTVIYQDRKGVLWFGSSSHINGGLSCYDGKNWRVYSTKDGLPHNAVNAIVEDNEGVWVGTGFANEGGACHFVDGKWQTIGKKDGLAGEKVRSVFFDREGRMLFGSEYDGLAVYNSSNWKVYKPAQGLAGKEIKEILQDENSVYWLATENGLSRIEKLD